MATIKPVSFTDAYASEENDILRRQKMAEMLQQQANSPLDVNRMSGGWAIPISPLEGAAKLAQGAAGGYMQKQADDKRRELIRQMQGDASKWYGSQPQGTPAQIQDTTQEGTGSFDMSGSQGPANVPAQAPSQQQNMQWLMQGMNNPMSAPIAQTMLKQQLEPPKYHVVNGNLVAEPKQGQQGQVIPAFTAPETKVVGPGHSLVQVPRSGEPAGAVKPIYTAPMKEKADELGSILDAAGIDRESPTGKQLYQALAVKMSTHQPAAATSVKVNSFLPASEEAQRDFMKSTRATYDQLKQAPVLLSSLEKAKTLVPSAKGFMGPGGEALLEAAKFLNNRVGTNIATEGVKSAEELRTRIFFNIMDNLKKMDAQPSQMQQQIMMESLGKLGTDPNALPNVLDAFGDVIRGKVELHNQEVKGAADKGVKFPYDPTINIGVSKPKVATPLSKEEQAELDRLKAKHGRP